jgi:hypothetical protein
MCQRKGPTGYIAAAIRPCTDKRGVASMKCHRSRRRALTRRGQELTGMVTALWVALNASEKINGKSIIRIRP